MRLFLLTPNWESKLKKEGREKWPWDMTYDIYYGFVIRAESEEKAREAAAEEADSYTKEAWKDPEYTKCVELTRRGKEEIILSDFNAG